MSMVGKLKISSILPFAVLLGTFIVFGTASPASANKLSSTVILQGKISYGLDPLNLNCPTSLTFTNESGIVVPVTLSNTCSPRTFAHPFTKVPLFGFCTRYVATYKDGTITKGSFPVNRPLGTGFYATRNIFDQLYIKGALNTKTFSC